jgi:hypothetical protein
MWHCTQKILQDAAFIEYFSGNEVSGWGGRCGCDGWGGAVGLDGGQRAAVDGELAAGEIGGARREEECDQLRDVGGGTGPASRDVHRRDGALKHRLALGARDARHDPGGRGRRTRRGDVPDLTTADSLKRSGLLLNRGEI